MKTILLIDGSNFLFRAFFALPPMTTKDGRHTEAVRGFISMLNVLRKEVPTDYIACVFDPKGKSFRSDIYPQYKATREPTPEVLVEQIPLVFDAVRFLGIPLLQIPGYEADDTIGTIAKKAQAEGFQVVIATGDKDFAQLVNTNVQLLNTMAQKNGWKWLDPAGVVEKFGVPPEHITDYLALMGDKVDNVPGVPKCGKVTAAKWVKEYGTVENLMAKASEVTGKIGESLRASLGFLPVAKNLVTICTEAKIWSEDLKTIEDLKVKAPDKAQLLALYNDLEFRTWARSLEEKKPSKVKVPIEPEENTLELFKESLAPQSLQEEPVQVISTDEQLAGLADKLRTLGAVALYPLVDGEGFESQLRGFAICAENKRLYVAVSDELGAIGAQMLASELGAWASDANSPKFFYDSKSARHAFANAGITLAGVQDDVLLQSYVLESHRPHALEKVAADWLKLMLDDEERLLGKGAKKKTFQDIALEQAARYATERACAIFKLAEIFNTALKELPKLEGIYRDIELPVSLVLFRMERCGVLIDTKRLAEQTKALKAQEEKLLQEAYKIAGHPFKLNSPKQLGEVLFDEMGAQIDGAKPKKTAAGNYSTSEEVLSELALDYPLAKCALEYRATTKLISTYTDKLPQMVASDGRVHTTFEQAVAVTGRLSSVNPNLQNIPVRTAEGRRVREAFVAAPGCSIISADYSQIELRLMAHISGDEGLVSAFKAEKDVHRATAAEVFGKPLEEVTSEERRMAKVVNFGLMYGMSAFGLAKNLGIERSAAKTLMDKYFHHYPKIRQYMDQIRAKAAAQGFVETIFGRRLQLPDIASSGPRRAAAERAAVNGPMQGSAADLIKISMIRLQQWLDEQGLKSRIILQVHDELILEVPDEEIARVREGLPRVMNGAGQLSIPLVTDVGVGPSWEAAH